MSFKFTDDEFDFIPGTSPYNEQGEDNIGWNPPNAD